MYLTYEEYRAMGGGADESAFARLCAAACGRIDRLTHGRIRQLPAVPQEVKLAAFELIRRAQADESGDARMAAFANDGMSVTYAQDGAREREAALNAAVTDLLEPLRAADGRTRLLYAGVGR